MMFEILPALLSFCFVSSITPGPNNLMLMASGANYGFMRTLPHMIGVGLGFSFMVVLVGIGLARIFALFPVLNTVLTLCSVAYLLYLAWKIASAAPLDHSDQVSNPMTFFQAVLFQWVNPKAWTMAVTAVTVYAPDTDLGTIVFTALVFGAVNLPCISIWVVAGQQVARFLTNPIRLRLFNAAMAALLILSLYPAVLHK